MVKRYDEKAALDRIKIKFSCLDTDTDYVLYAQVQIAWFPGFKALGQSTAFCALNPGSALNPGTSVHSTTGIAATVLAETKKHSCGKKN